ncbi:hypothetical protein BaRGS_00023643, partial [Batillaria attramentaria]
KMNESLDIDFIYDDSDRYCVEIAELYSYTEECEFVQTQCSYEELSKAHGMFLSVTVILQQFCVNSTAMDHSDASRAVTVLINPAEHAGGGKRERRMLAMQAILYLVQEEHLEQVQKNARLVYELGIFNSFVELLGMELDRELRCIINVLYTVVETLRTPREEENRGRCSSQGGFSAGNGSTSAGRGSPGNRPVHHVLLTSLGGLRELQEKKNGVRAQHNLPPLPEDTYEVSSAADLIEQQAPRRGARGGKRSLVKQSSLDDPFDGGLDRDEDLMREMEGLKTGSDDEMPPTPPRPATPSVVQKSLPWKPKVRQKDLEQFLEHTRAKFVGFQVKNDHTSLAGLPQPIHEGVKVLKQHLYVSLSELQIKREEEIAKNPLSRPETAVEQTAGECLYQAMLPNLPQYMGKTIALLKLLLAAAPTSKAKTESINILSDVLPEEMPTTVLQSMKLGIDVNRHKEIIVKAISGMLLLLLKHFKLNHVYQFEFTSQHLVFANCIPLVLKFFNQNILSYVSAKNGVPALEFPKCVIGDQPELTAENIVRNGDGATYCWRNIFSCINLLRILNKLTKWKHSRTMMLVVFKSAHHPEASPEGASGHACSCTSSNS